MTRRARRPHFGPGDRDDLLAALHSARSKSITCGAAAGYGTPRWLKCDALLKAIDEMAEELTGHRNWFHDQGSTSVPLYKR